MPAPKGNQYYKLRSKDGRDRIFSTPQDLADACNEYFQWVIDNPFQEQNLFAYQGVITKGNADKMRPMTVEGLCNFIDIAKSTLFEYKKKEDFTNIVTRAIQIIENQQFEGAASGFLNPNIIARKLGLSDKQDHTSKGEQISATQINLTGVSTEALEEIMRSKKEE